MKEIQFISTLSHPNTVKHFGSYVKGQYIWMAMEFCLGSASDLLDVFKEGMAEQDIAAIIGETAEGLAYLHKQGKIHR
jgi:serine/threonine protein kinase